MHAYRNTVLLILFAVMAGIYFPARAQKSGLYIPLNIQKTYRNHTRSMDGRPGARYWQNRSEYTIRAELIPDSSLLRGEEEIVYHNQSPDTLKRMVFRLYQDFFKKGNGRQFPVPPEELTDGVVFRYFIVGNDTIDANKRSKKAWRSLTNLIVKLNQPLPPGQTIPIKAAWYFRISRKMRLRMGQYGDSTFFIAYWYPQVAVYDDLDGWDMQAYYGSTEFYNDFNHYDVSLTLPGDYLVWATGELQNPAALLTPAVLERYRRALTSDSTVRIVRPVDYRNGRVTTEGDRHTWHFVANNVTDFSFAAARGYNWDGASVEVDAGSHRRVLTDVAYPDSADHWKEGAQFARTAIDYLSRELPGVPYPYSHVTSFCNGTRRGGMETPMMTNDGTPKERIRLAGLLFHEIAHTYFPFYMGTNERKYAWMDEGWATFFPRETVERMKPDYDYWGRVVKAYQRFAGQEAEMPMITLSYLLYARSSYRIASYNRPANAYNFLREILGDELFKKALREYIRRWHGRHPMPYDFFFTFEDVAGKNLEWFWKPWFFDRGYPDLGIKKVKKSGNKYRITVKRYGEIPIPVSLTVIYADSSSETVYRPITVWEKGDSKIKIEVKSDREVREIQLGNAHIPDAVAENNVYRFGPK